MRRLRLDITTTATHLPWDDVLGPGRGVVRGLLTDAPRLAAALDARANQQLPAPIGYGAPRFPGAQRQPGQYAAGGRGVVEIGSPIPAVVDAWVAALSRRRTLQWGSATFQVNAVTAVDPPAYRDGHARWHTETPVLLKTIDGTDRPTWILPGEAGWSECLVSNAAHKARSVGLPDDVTIVRRHWAGAQRSFGRGKPGAAVEVELEGDPRTLRALWCWGLGMHTSAGHGWIRA